MRVKEIGLVVGAACAFVVASAGCGTDSSAPASVIPADAGAETVCTACDAAPDEGATDTSTPDAHDADATVVDTGDAAVEDATDSADAADDGDTLPTTSDADVECGATGCQATFCAKGAPRLEWTGTGCFDHGVGLSVPRDYFCEFRMASDGKRRCLPRDVTALYGAREAACVDQALTTWNTDPLPTYVMVGNFPYAASSGTPPVAGAWWKIAPSCEASTTGYPYASPSGKTLVLGTKFAVTDFFSADP